MQWDGTEGGAARIALNDGFDGKLDYNSQGFCGLYINTLEGKMKVSPLDFVIRGVNGEFYPCKEDIFIKTYEAV
jgi:hypothetical protein